jgi:hypothetical protein
MAPSTAAPRGEQPISELRFWKSATPSGEEKRAVPEVGNTWLGPAQ